MVSYIVDTSVLIQRFIVEAETPQVIAMFRQVKLPDELCVPEFCPIECINVLWKRVRFHGMAVADAELLIRDLQKLQLRLLATETVYMQAFQIGIKYQLAIYDSIYIALAKQLNYPLITVDQKQMQAATQEHVTVTPLTSFVP